MEFEWDEKKNRQNQAKHGVAFSGAALVFVDTYRIEAVDDRNEYGETRYQTIGKANEIILFVVYTQRNHRYRLISARRATKDEREIYLYHRHLAD